ncbi:MAG: relaxase/mobilization nuclease domain-containing protein [Bacteroidota bacterium]|nr:relaxase/mobilization nuclease domain-containing protein [Bacteroidota bacterium]
MKSAIFKIMPAAGSRFNAVNYNEKKVKQGKAGLVYFENFGNLQDRSQISKEEFKKYLQNYSGRNTRIKNPVFHATCSCKNNELSHEQLKEIALNITQQLGYAENPIMIYEHHDTKNNHVHIVSSRVGINGKKVNDSFEGKRANHFLNAILNREPHQEFNQHLNSALTYKFGTHAQFCLLMEINGYKAQKTKDQLLFFKHGEQQGFVQLSDLDKKIVITEKSGKNINQIKAIIYKYRKQYSGKLQSNHDIKFTTEPTKFESDLTNLLKQKFGYDFIFFSGKNKDIPYGYVFIDHNKREVYKGSDLLKLDLLISDVVNKEKTSFSKSGGYIYTKTVNENSIAYFHPEIEFKSEMQLGNILSDFLEEVERANYLGNGRPRNKRNRTRKGI